jgi:N-acetyl-anhydromuramyl-L-alanine amidase AmpD
MDQPTHELPEIIIIDFPKDQYYQEECHKKTIILHHTASGRGVEGDYRSWLVTTEHVATSHLIGWDGKVYQLYNSKFWAHHIGSTTANNRELNQQAIGIEIDSWGGLTYDIDKKVFKSYTGQVVAPENVIEYPKSFRGYRFFEKYTPVQIEAVRKLMLFWGHAYGIDLTYNPDMWDMCDRAIQVAPGVWTHVTYRKDKSDLHPQPEMIAMLQSLKPISA